MIEKCMIIDGVRVPFSDEKNILEVVRKADIELPTFCYHPELSIFGACRMCVIETERGGMEAACSTPPKDGMSIKTNSPKLLKHRKMILELLLSSHRCECTTCEKSGKCKLQEYANLYGVKTVRFPNKYCTEPIDNSSPSIVRDPSKCILCGACTHTCFEIQNVGAIDFVNRGADTFVTTAFQKKLSETNCVNCGQCVTICPTGALLIKNEINKAWDYILNPKKKVVVQVAPAVRVALGEEFGIPSGVDVVGKINAALKKMGVDAVYDTSFTADMTIVEETQEFLGKLNSGQKLPLFTSCCPAWVKHAENAHPELIPQISTAGSPMEMFGATMRKYFRENEPEKDVVSIAIMPCTAKKFEAQRPELVKDGERLIDLVLTTDELCTMIKAAGIDLASLEPEAADLPFATYSGGGVIFGVTGGVTEAVIRKVVGDTSKTALEEIKFCGVRGLEGTKECEVQLGDRTLRIAIVSGLKNADILIEKIQNGEVEYDFVEVMACPNGCINGGGQPHSDFSIRKERSKGLYKADKMCTLKNCDENTSLKYVYENVIRDEAHHLLHVHYSIPTTKRP